jgi:thiol-disulfide isomerase/thioredoxin
MFEIVCVVLILLIIFYGIKCSFGPKAKVTVFLFYRNGCGWCDKIKPEWQRFTKMHSGSNEVEVRAINSEENQQMANDYGVSGVPHIVRECNGVRTIYQGDRSAESLYKFSNER